MTVKGSVIPPEVITEYQNSCLLNDAYAKAFFEDNISGVQYVLRIIMGKPDLIVKTLSVQKVMRGADNSRSVRFDVYATDSEDRQYDIEFQIEPEGANAYRAVYNVSILTVNTLKPKEGHTELVSRERVVIFITATDVLGNGLPLYTIERVVVETGERFDDGEVILYVNASHKDNTTELGRLLHDIRSTRTADMFSKELAERSSTVRKEKEAMSALKDWENTIGIENREDEREKIAVNLISIGRVAFDDIAIACHLPLQRVQELAATLQA